MNALSDALPESFAFVPTDQVSLLASYEPDEWAEGTSAKAAPAGLLQFQQLREYLADRLIAGPVEELRDRISALLRDEHYHKLNSALGDVIPINSLLNTVVEKQSGEFRLRDLGEHQKSYARGLLLQVHVLASFLAFITSGKSGLHLGQRAKDSDRLAFMRERLPAALKRALLSMWVAPMLSVAVTAFGDATPKAVKIAVLKEWTDNLEQGLALFLALGIRATPIEGVAPEDLVPPERRLQMNQLKKDWKQGMERTLERMEAMDRK